MSINDVCCRSVTSKNNIKSSEQEYVGLNKSSHTGVVMELNNNNINTSEQDCINLTHFNRYAVLCVDSSEDEGDSLDFDTVNNPDASYSVRGFQGGESVGIHSKLGKKIASFVKNSEVETVSDKVEHLLGNQIRLTNSQPKSVATKGQEGYGRQISPQGALNNQSSRYWCILIPSPEP